MIWLTEFLCIHSWFRGDESFRERECPKCGRHDFWTKHRGFVRIGNTRAVITKAAQS